MGPGRESRFRALAVEVTPVVGAYLRRRLYPLSEGDLDDLVEETLLVVWRRLDDVPADAGVAWSIGVARNVLRNAQRKRRRALAVQDRLRPAPPSAPAEDLVIADEGVRHALAALSDDDREILLLHAWDGRSATEIAEIFHLSTNAAAVRLSRAESRFRRLFTEAVVE
ncbi:MAG: sigma-70 family RNA polymerase sigma factor [Acidobacteriota bacterium]|nr:sigma-70 family RNA polymerase sigma factor [Acidobacteriota bacterium]